MRQNVPWSLEGLDLDTREAAKEAARRAGMSVDEWIAATIADRAARYGEQPAPRRRTAAVQQPSPDELDAVASRLNKITRGKGAASRDLEAIMAVASAETDRRARDSAAKTAVALDSVARWIERAEDRFTETSRFVSERQDRTTAILGEALGLMTRRLDDIEKKVVEGQQPSMALALKALEKVEAHVARMNDASRDTAQSAQIEAALRAFETRIAGLTERIAANKPLGRRGVAPRDEILEAVAEIKSRQAEIEAGPAAPVRRDSPALAEIASHTRSHAEILHSLKGDIARLAGQLDSVRAPDPTASVVAAVRGEMEDIQHAVRGLATRREVAALEGALVELNHRVGAARDIDPVHVDLRSVTAPIEELQAEVQRLSEVVAAGVHNRLAGDIENLARKVDIVAGAGVAPEVVDALSRQLADVRRVVGEIAEPQRVHGLAEQMADLSRQVAQVARNQVDALEFASLKNTVDDIRAVIKMPRAGKDGPEILRAIDSLTKKLDNLEERIPSGDISAVEKHLKSLSEQIVSQSTPTAQILSRLDDLSTRLQQPASADPMAERFEEIARRLSARDDAAPQILSRLDDLAARLETPRDAAPAYEPLARDDIRPLEDLLRQLAGRLEAAPGPAGSPDTLDALERQVREIADRLDRTPSSDPALATLERGMSELMAQMESFRDLGASAPAQAPNLDAVSRELADLRAHYSQTDKRNRDTLEAVHGSLEKLVQRLASLEQEPPRRASGRPATPPPASSRAETRADQPAVRPEVRAFESALPAADAVDADLARRVAALAQDADRPLPPPPPAPGRSPEILLEPGAGRPRFDSAADHQDGDASDIKASFIAAARRAAQAAASEAAAAAAQSRPGQERGRRTRSSLVPAGLADRMRKTLEKRRRPLLIGLAAIVLAIGAIQIGGALFSGGDAPKPMASRSTPDAALPAPAAEAPAGAAASIASPETTQSIPQQGFRQPVKPPALEPAPAAPQSRAPSPAETLSLAPVPDAPKPAEVLSAAGDIATGAIARPNEAQPQPRPALIANIGDIPASVGPAALRKAALAGEPAAVFELASRAAEGRGMNRDPKLAARLFERAAAHGSAPAQFRIGSHYEKGIGVTRDVALAKLWYQRAAEKGNARAMHNLAVLLAEGAGEKPDYIGAVDWFRRAAEHGVRDSQYNLAVLLARGLGTRQDLGGAYIWFAVAAGQGDADAGKKRDEVASRLNASELTAAKSAADRWRPEIPDRDANEPPVPSTAWLDSTGKASQKSAQRT